MTEIWVSEHYWPALAAELVDCPRATPRPARARSPPSYSRASRLPSGSTSPKARTTYGGRCGRVGLGSGSIGAGWLIDHGNADN